MILDNRQVVPDIIVSRDGVPNYSFAYNVNSNFNNNQGNQYGQADRAPDSPRHFAKGVSQDIPRHPYATGNNNGSPRRVPNNGNYYNEVKQPIPAYYDIDKTLKRGGSLQGKSSGKGVTGKLVSQNFDCVPHQRTSSDGPKSPRHVFISPDSPVRNRSDLTRKYANNPYAPEDVNKSDHSLRQEDYHRRRGSFGGSTHDSPLHQPYRSPSLKQNVFFSPMHSPKKTFPLSPRRIPPCTSNLKENALGSRNESYFSFPLKEAYRPRSSSQPREETKLTGSGQSKIPVHVVKPTTRQSFGKDEEMKFPQASSNAGDNALSNLKNLNQRTKTTNDNIRYNRDLVPDSETQSPKLMNNTFIPVSPKRVNIPYQNENPSPRFLPQQRSPRHQRDSVEWNANRRRSLEPKQWNNDTSQWNKKENETIPVDRCNVWNIDNDQQETISTCLQEEFKLDDFKELNKNKVFYNLGMYPATENGTKGYSDCDSKFREDTKFNEKEENVPLEYRDSGVESDCPVSSRIVLIKCKDANYLTRIFVNSEGIHGLRVVGRVGVGGSAQGHVMSFDQPAVAPGDLNSNHSVCSDDVGKSCDVTGRELSSENTGSIISQATDAEFEHEAADYQWLLDYEYRESYSRDSLGGGRDGSTRVSVLQQGADESHMSYETLSRNIDANLAEIDMDDFRSEDIHQLLSLPTMCNRDPQDGSEDDIYCSVSGSLSDPVDKNPLSNQQQYRNKCTHYQHQRLQHHQQEQLHKEYFLQQRQQQVLQQLQQIQKGEDEDGRDGGGQFSEESQNHHQPPMFEGAEREEETEEEFSGVSGDVSLYQSGPLFSPLKEPPQIPPSFSVDSLDSDSMHEDLILTCQANKNNYTIAFEGSFVQYSEDSDFQETALSDAAGSGTWSTERLEGRSPAPNMTYSDQPYTTWSRVSRRSSQSRTPDPAQTHSSKQRGQSPLPACEKQLHHHPLQPHQLKQRIQGSVHQQESKSNSMPNLMRRSLMRRSLETSGNCIKVYDLQNSLRSSHLSSTRSVDANNFSLMRLFIKQKSLSKEAVSISSSCTDPSQEGACSSSENQSGVNDSSDWPMNSQSENDMDGSASPVPVTALNNHMMHDRLYRGRVASPNIMSTVSQDSLTNAAELTNSHGNISYEGMLNNNNLAHLVDNANSNPIDNITSFEDSFKETNPCSKPPMTSPIREEPEGMDISVDSRCENKVLIDQSEKEPKGNDVLRLRDNNRSNLDHITKTSTKPKLKDAANKNFQENKNAVSAQTDDKKRSELQVTPKHQLKKEALNSSQRKRQDSGNSSSGYISNKGSTERIRRSSESEKLINVLDRPKPKPRSLKQVADQCLQTSNLKVSATVNTSGIADKKEVYVYYPNYALPDLGFLREKKYSVDARIFLVPQHYAQHNHEHKAAAESKPKRPFSCGDMEKLKKHGFGHVRDWESLNFLLPKELKEMLLDDTECMETIKPSFCKPSKMTQQRASQDVKESKGSTSSLNSTQPSSGYRGSSTMLNDSQVDATPPQDPRYVYQYDSDYDERSPIPRRSSSLQNDGNIPVEGDNTPRPPLPRGILRKCTTLRDTPHRQSGSKRHSVGDSSSRGATREDLVKRRSLQEPLEAEQPEDSHQKCKQPAEAGKGSDSGTIMKCSCISDCTGFCAKELRKKNLLLVDELPEVSSHEEFTDADLVRLRAQVSEFLAAKGGQVLPHDSIPATCDCPRKSVSFAKTCTHRQQTPVVNPIQKKKARTPDEDLPPMLYDAHDKKTLVLSVRAAVEKLVHHFNKGNSQQEKNKLGASLQTPEVAKIALEKLCPAIYALLSDGLLPSLHSLFGKISNSVWRVVEATSQMGPSTKALNDLVLTLNSEECLSEGPIKFNAFVFGLLNIRSLDAWLGYLRTRESALQKHYHPESFLYLSNTAMRGLYDDLLLALRPLALLPFRLDLLHEYKDLHASLLKMEERLALHTSQSPTDSPMDLLLAAKESKEFRNAAARTTDRSRSPRPRSCHENAIAGGLDDVQEVLRKRWSGVQLGSRLVTAIDRLMTEEAGGGASSSSGDYTDSLEPFGVKGGARRRDNAVPRSDSSTTDMRVSDLSSQDVSERSATDKDTDTEKGLRLEGRLPSHAGENESEGEKFRRLQLKWEAMTGQNTYPNAKVSSRGVNSFEEEFEEDRDKERVDSITSPAGVQRSRIPRPVSITSPQQAFKAFEVSKEKTSPQVKQTRKTSLTLSSKDHPKPAPRRSLKERVIPTDHRYYYDQQPPTSQRGGQVSVRARVGSRSQVPSNNANSSALVGIIPGSSRASSVPGRKMERGSSGTRYEGQMRGSGATPRSASQGRRRGHAEETRFVQTLHHRLATDNGHLSFSRGDVLTIIVEVDERFLLCCLHDRKGLVPRTSVVPYNQ